MDMGTEKDTLLTIPLVEYAWDEQYDDPYLYKGLLPQNYLAKTKLSVLKHSKVLAASQRFNKVQQSLDAWVSAFVDILPHLPSGRTSASYLVTKLLPFAHEVAYDYPKFCIKNRTHNDVVDAMIDLDFLGFDMARLCRYINNFDRDYYIFSDSAAQSTQQAKDKLRQVVNIVGKELPTDIFQRELQRIVTIRNSSDKIWNLCQEDMECLRNTKKYCQKSKKSKKLYKGTMVSNLCL